MAGPRRSGPAPIPTEQKRLRGNPGHQKLPKGNVVALAPLAATVMAPDHSDGDALIRALLDSPASAWIAEPDRLALLVLVRDAWNERARLRAVVADLEGWEAGRYTPAAILRLAQVEKDLTTWLSQLGLTPTDRSRLGVAEVKARTKLEALRDRRAARGHAG